MEFLKTPRLTLRNVNAKDAEEIFDYRNNEICARYQRDQIRDLDGIRELMVRRQNDTLSVDANTMLAVTLKDTDQIIGEIIIMPNEGTISLGYTFSYKVHRNGYAYEALSALIELLHEKYPEWDYISFIEVDNIPSRKLLEKLGYTDMGYLASLESQVYGKWLRQDTIDEITEAMEEGDE